MALRQTLPIREVLRGRRISWVDVVVGVAIIVVLYVVVRLGQGLSVNFTPGRAPVVISTDISNVPYYAARSLLRMFIALALSTVFALAYGTAAAPLSDGTKATAVDLPTSSASGLTPSHPQSPQKAPARSTSETISETTSNRFGASLGVPWTAEWPSNPSAHSAARIKTTFASSQAPPPR